MIVDITSSECMARNIIQFCFHSYGLHISEIVWWIVPNAFSDLGAGAPSLEPIRKIEKIDNIETGEGKRQAWKSADEKNATFLHLILLEQKFLKAARGISFPWKPCAQSIAAKSWMDTPLVGKMLQGWSYHMS